MNIRIDSKPSLAEKEDAESTVKTEHARKWTIPGFLGKAKVMTSFGNLPIEALRLRDPVKTRSGHFRKVVWVDQLHLDSEFVFDFPDSLPVQIGNGALGPDFPPNSVQFSPAQVVLPSRHGGKSVPVRDLVGRPRIIRPLPSTFTYYLFHCGQQEDVLVDGMWCHTSP